jgi:translocation and assembly module TamB
MHTAQLRALLNGKAGRWVLAMLLGSALLAGATGWLVGSTGGLNWAVSTLEVASAGRLIVDGAEGRLAGPLRARTLSLAVGGKRVTVRDLRLDWQPRALLAGRLELRELAAASVDLLLPPDTTPTPLPADLRLPLPLHIDALHIDLIQTFETPDGPATRLASGLHARLDSDGRRHRVPALTATLEAGQLQASGALDGAAPFPLQASATLAGDGPPALRLAATAGGTLSAIDVKLESRGDALRAQGEARLTPFAAFPLAALRLSAEKLDPHVFAAAAPHALLTLKTDLQATPSGALAGPLHLRNAAPAPIDHGGLPLAALDARLTLAAGALRLDDLTAALAGDATLGGRVDLHWAPGQLALPHGRADLSAHHLDPAALHSALRAAHLDGHLRLDGDRTVQHGVLTLSDGTLQLDARLTQRAQRLTLDSVRLMHGSAELAGSGEVRLAVPHDYRFSGALRRFDLAAFIDAPRSSVNATLEAAGQLSPQPAGTLQFAIGDASRLAAQALTGQGRVEFSGTQRVSGAVQLRLGSSRLDLQGGLGGAQDVLHLALSAPALAQHGFGLAGALDLQATLAGTPARPQLTLHAKARALALPGGQRLASLDADGRLQGDDLALSIAADDYRQGDVLRLARLRVSVAGLRQRHRVLAEARLADGTTLRLSASGGLQENVKNWRDSGWRGTLDEFVASGALPFSLQAPASLSANRQRVTLGAASIALAGGRVQLVESEWTPQRWRSVGSFAGVALRPAGLSEAAGESVLRLAGDWALAGSTRLEGRFSMHRESGDWTLPGYLPRALGLQELRLDAHSEGPQVVADLAANGARIGRWQVHAALPLAHGDAGWAILPQAPLSGRLRVAVPDLSWVGPAVNSNVTSGGRLDIDGELAGTLSAPRTHGQIKGSALAIALLDENVALQQGSLEARFDQEILHIDRLDFVAPQAPPARAARLAGWSEKPAPGHLTASGAIDLAKRSGRLEAQISRLPLAQRAERWIVASGHGQASFADNLLTLGARVTADAGFLAQAASDHPQLADDVKIVGRTAPTRRGPRIDSDIAFDLGEHFHLRAAGLEARLSGELRLRGEPGRPLRASGAIATNDALFEAFGQRLTVERGIVSFQGPLDNPALNVLAVRKGLAVEAGVAVSGTAQHPLVRLVSTPAVADSEKLSWIVLGRVPDAGGTDSSLLLAAAGAILGGQSKGITGQLAQALGVDELALRQAKSGDPLTSQILTLGKRLSARAFLSYEHGLSAAAGVMKLSYTLTPRVSLITRAGADNALDVFYTFSFD